VFTTAQALVEGWTPRQIKRRIADGRWVRVAGAGLARPSQRWTPFQYGMAARLTWPNAVVSHRTAALLHSFPVAEPPGADVIAGKGYRSRRALFVHLSAAPLDDVVTVGPGIRVTGPRRTGLDCLSELPFGDALDLWAWLSTREVLSWQDLDDAVRERRRLHGTPQLRRLAEETRQGAVSGGERRLHGLLRDAGIGGWQANCRVEDGAGSIGVVDILFPEARIVIEFDGVRAHSATDVFVRDRRRQNRLLLAGYAVLRFTWADLTERPHEVVAEIKRLLETRRFMQPN